MAQVAVEVKRRLLPLLAVASIGLAAPVITHFEGRSLIAYLDPVGVPTICDGVTPGVKLGDTATDAECDSKRAAHMQSTLDGLTRCIHADLPANQWAALTSWAYNIGVGAACASGVVRMINAGRAASVWCPQLARWVYAGGQKLKGLERRRAAEIELCTARQA